MPSGVSPVKKNNGFFDGFINVGVKGIKVGGKMFAAPSDAARNFLNRSSDINIHPEPTSQGPPSLKKTVFKVIDIFKNYFLTVWKNGSKWSLEAELFVDDLLKRILTPLKYCRIGEALRTTIADKLAGIVRVVSFAMLQLFLQPLPYALAGTVIAGATLLFQTSPVALIAILAGSALLIQILQTYTFSEIGNQVKESLEKQSEAVQESLNTNTALIAQNILQIEETAKNFLPNPLNWPRNAWNWLWNKQPESPETAESQESSVPTPESESASTIT